MMKKLLLLSFIFLSGYLTAQNLHFTQFQMAPMSFNPAQTGGFYGTLRVGGIYRDQWSTFQTPSVFADAPILTVFKRDWVGVGLSFVSDKAGDAKLSRTSFKLSGAFHHAFDKKQKTVLSIGVQGGTVGRSVDREALVFEDELLAGTTTSIDDGSISDASYVDIDAGINLRSAFSKTADMSIGVGVLHINQPKYGLIDRVAKLPMRIVAHGQLNMDLNKKWVLSPAVLFQSMSSEKELELQGVGGYKFNEDWRFRVGAGYRIGDAIQAILGAKYKDLNVGLSYDITASDASNALTNSGAIEIAANYIFKLVKKPTVDPAIFCPRF